MPFAISTSSTVPSKLIGKKLQRLQRSKTERTFPSIRLGLSVPNKGEEEQSPILRHIAVCGKNQSEYLLRLESKRSGKPDSVSQSSFHSLFSGPKSSKSENYRFPSNRERRPENKNNSKGPECLYWDAKPERRFVFSLHGAVTDRSSAPTYISSFDRQMYPSKLKTDRDRSGYLTPARKAHKSVKKSSQQM
jgi:hypothetical protein